MLLEKKLSTKHVWLKNIIYVLLASPGLFLLVNKYQYFAIVSVLIVLLLGVIFLLLKGTITYHHQDILAILAIIYLYFLLSYFISNQPISGFLAYRYLRYDGSFFFCYLPFFALAVPYFNYEKVSKIYVNFIFIVFSLFSIWGIIGLVTKNYPPIFLYASSEGATFIALNRAHNATGSVYAVVSIFALVFLLYSSKKLKIIYGAVFALSLFGLIISKSRGGLIAFAAVALMVIWFYYESFLKFIITSVALAVLSLPIIYLTGYHERLLALFDATEWGVKTRVALWGRAWDYFNSSPIFGVGFARYNDVPVLRGHRLIGLENIAAFFMGHNFDYSAGHAHNSYLNFLSETGIIGLGLLILFWLLCFLKIKKGYHSTTNLFTKKMFLSTLGSIATLFVLAVTENYFSATTIMVFMSMVVSLSIGLYWQEQHNPGKNNHV
jgi:O-antigen ligase